ncbi:MAG: hypothetical protein ACQR33_04495 [Candidatus Saccharibacteria bacterium]
MFPFIGKTRQHGRHRSTDAQTTSVDNRAPSATSAKPKEPELPRVVIVHGGADFVTSNDVWNYELVHRFIHEILQDNRPTWVFVIAQQNHSKLENIQDPRFWTRSNLIVREIRNLYGIRGNERARAYSGVGGACVMFLSSEFVDNAWSMHPTQIGEQTCYQAAIITALQRYIPGLTDTTAHDIVTHQPNANSLLLSEIIEVNLAEFATSEAPVSPAWTTTDQH